MNNDIKSILDINSYHSFNESLGASTTYHAVCKVMGSPALKVLTVSLDDAEVSRQR